MQTSFENPPPSSPEKPKKSYIPLWILGGLFVFLFLVTIAVEFGASQAELGVGAEEGWIEEEESSTFVKMENEIESYELDLIEARKYLRGSEKIITYYDKWVDRSEIFLLTNERIIYDTDGHITSIPLDQIQTIREYETDQFDIYVIAGKDGSLTKIEIFQYEGSAVFERELNDAREKLN